jgi:hypothetical protein
LDFADKIGPGGSGLHRDAISDDEDEDEISEDEDLSENEQDLTDSEEDGDDDPDDIDLEEVRIWRRHR